MKNFGFSTSEKLKKEKEISFLFKKGKWKTHGNIRMIVLKNQEVEQPKIAVTVSKKFFKKAVDRNRIKRLLREIYRLNKDLFTETYGENSLSMIFWVSKEKPLNYQSLEENFIALCNSKHITSKK